MFSDRNIAMDFLRNYLPNNILSHINLDTLEQEDGGFVDDAFKETYSDILYTVKVQEKQIYLYLLFEHKSYPDKFTAFQLLKYMTSIWDRFSRNNPDRLLPAIMPLVIYHGESKWNYENRFLSLVDTPGFVRGGLLDFSFQLWDLSQMADSDIRGMIASQLFLLFLKHIRDSDLEEKLPALIELMNELYQGDQNGGNYIRLFVTYLANGTDKLDRKKIVRYFEKYQNLRDTVMPTLAEQFKAEGKIEGKVEEKIEAARRMLEDGLSVDKVMLYTGLTMKDLKQAGLIS